MKKYTKQIVATFASLSTYNCYFDYSSQCIPRHVSSSDDNVELSTPSSNGDESPCRYYNSLEQRFSWAVRRDRCNSESGCHFLGRRFTGTCVSALDHPTSVSGRTSDTVVAQASIPSVSTANLVAAAPESKPADSSTSSTANDTADTRKHRHRLYAEIIDNDIDERSPLRVLVHETLSSSAVDSIRDSQQLANELAKCLLIEVLDRSENPGKLGLLLQYLFEYDAVLSPTRELIYWSLIQDETVKNTIFYTNLNRNYWLGLSTLGQHVRTNRGVERQRGAKELTQEVLLALAIQWLSDPETHKIVITPLLDWTLKSQESVITPLAALTAESIPTAKVRCLYWKTSCSRPDLIPIYYDNHHSWIPNLLSNLLGCDGGRHNLCNFREPEIRGSKV